MSDPVDAICDGDAPWLAEMSDDEFRDLLAAYEREQLAVAAGLPPLTLARTSTRRGSQLSAHQERQLDAQHRCSGNGLE